MSKKKLSTTQKAVRLGLVGIGLYLFKELTDKMVENYDKNKPNNKY